MNSEAASAASSSRILYIGVLCLQGAFIEHRRSIERLNDIMQQEMRDTNEEKIRLEVIEVRTAKDLYLPDSARSNVHASSGASTSAGVTSSYLSGLIIPGGESTSMTRLLRDHDQTGLLDAIRHFIRQDKRPVFGTCAGAILLSDTVVNGTGNATLQTNTNTSAATTTSTAASDAALLGGISMSIARNWYGRQLSSFETTDLNIRSETIKQYQEGQKTLKQSEPISPASTPYTTVSPQSPAAIFIRAPAILQVSERVDVLAELPAPSEHQHTIGVDAATTPTISASLAPVAVREGNLLATCFHPELSTDLSWHRYFVDMCKQH